MAKDNSNKNHSSSIKGIKRRDFLKQAGLLAGAGTLTVTSPVGFSNTNDEENVGSEKTLIYYSNTYDFTYWESLFFRCYQGIVNRNSARIYLNRYHKQTFLDWYKQYDHLAFEKQNDPYALLDDSDTYDINGYVLIDPEAPDSINVAANYASLENLLPVTEAFLSTQKLPDWEVKYDLRNTFKGVRFSNMSRIDIYKWVYENQWPQANHDLISIVSGAKVINGKPQTNFYTANSSRDYPVSEKALFFDLSSNPSHHEEYQLKDQLLSEMPPHEIVWGWHVNRDSEQQHICQLSKHGNIAVGGANQAPNFSFHRRVPVGDAVENFKEKNVNAIISDSSEEKVYLTFAMSDGDSINHLLRNAHGGQWLSDDRGAMPFNWEMQLKLVDIAPGVLDFFQSTATDNDYFIASASGIGYTYPTCMPAGKLKAHLYATKPYLRRTGMNAMVVLNNYRKLSMEKMGYYDEALGEEITGVIQGYTRAPATEYLFDRVDKESSKVDYMSWMSTSLPIAHTDSLDDLEHDLNLLAERRARRPLFVPIHTPRSYFRYSGLVDLVRRLDSNVFEVVDASSFNAMFTNARSNSVGINMPEFFIPDPVTLNNGRLNKLLVQVQNFNDEKTEAHVQARLSCDDWESPYTSTEKLELKPKQKTAVGMNISLRNRKGHGEGQLEYLVNGAPSIKVPVTFAKAKK